MTIVYLLLAALLLSFLPLLWIAARARFKHRGTKVVTCPETCGPAAVRLDGKHAAISTALGEPQLRIASCSQWPELKSCGRECLARIEAAPAECLVKTMLVDWYRGSSCALCGKEIGEIHWVEHKPALMTPGRKTVEWDDVVPERLPAVLATHKRVCWNCHIANSFRERFPGLTTQQPSRHAL